MEVVKDWVIGRGGVKGWGRRLLLGMVESGRGSNTTQHTQHNLLYRIMRIIGFGMEYDPEVSCLLRKLFLSTRGGQGRDTDGSMS